MDTRAWLKQGEKRLGLPTGSGRNTPTGGVKAKTYMRPGAQSLAMGF